MNMLLFLLLIAAGEAAYFEATYQQQTSDGFQQQESAWQTEDDALHAQNKQLIAAKADLEKAISAAESDVNDLTGKLQNPQGAPAANPAGATAGSAPAETAAPAAPPSVALEDFTAGDGQTYKNCQILKVEVDGVTFSHSDGITKVLGPNLPPDLQKRFQVDPASGQLPASVATFYNNFIQQHAPAPAQ